MSELESMLRVLTQDEPADKVQAVSWTSFIDLIGVMCCVVALFTIGLHTWLRFAA